MATAKPVVASSSSASITRNANFPSKSHIITESLPHQSTNDENIINVQNQRKRFTSEELKKFDENRRKTYEGRSNSIKATIQFKAIQDATAEEHLIGIADLIGFENIHSIGRINGQAIVSVANTELAESLLTKGFKVGNEVILPSPLFRTSKKYILSGVLSFIQDKDIEKALEPYGHMISIRPIPFPTENPLLKHLSSLRREVVFKTKENVSMPAVISINYMDQTFKIFIGEDVTCSGCRRHGHIRTRCPFDPEIREKVTRSFADALYPTSQPQTPKRPPTERDVPTAREIRTSSKKTHPATSPDRKSRPTPPGGGKATHSCSESDISTGTFSLREETSLRCEEWSMDSSQLQNELKECEKGDNPEVDKIIATIYRRADLSRQTKVLQQLEIYPDLETKISRHLEKWEDIKFKTFDDLDFDQRKAINDKVGRMRLILSILREDSASENEVPAMFKRPIGWIFQGLISTLQLVKKLDRYPFRKKRKIDSVEQEEKTMNIKKEATTQVGSFFVQHLPRNPSMFSGEGVEDPRSWLKGYERVAKHNQWDETLCLANVYFYLTGTALKWYENNEESIQTWTEFMSQLENVFGKNESSRLRAEKILKTRAQLKGESTEYYIQDVLRLCKEVDPQMNEEDKISHLMKGIAEELYQALIPRDVHNTEQFVTECRRIESIHCKRVTPTKYERLPNVASLSDHDDRADLSSMIRQIVREEVQRALGSTREEPKISNIEDMVKEEIGRTLAPISKPRRSSPQKERPREFYNNRYVAQTIRPQQPKQVNGRRDTNEWRTTEGKPICFHCGRPGHKTQPVASPFPSGKLEDASYFRGKAAKFINPPLSTTLELKENYIDIKIEGKMTRALVDSGASYFVISERFRLKLRKIMFAETDVTLRVANGKIVRPKGRCTLKLDLNGLQESFEFVVLEDCSHEVILGWNFLKLSRAIIDSADDTLFLEKCLFEDTPKNSSPLYSELEYRIEPASIQLIEVASRDIPNDAIVVAECRKELLLERELTAPSSVISLTNNRGKLWVVNWSPYPKLIPQGMHVADSAVIEDSQLCTLADCNQVETEAEHSEDPKISEFFIDDSLDESQKEKLRNLLKNYTDIFEFSKRKQFKDVNVKHRINTGDHLPTKQRPYRVAPRERQIIQDEVNKMENFDIIQPSESPWASPVVLIRKKDGSWRFCVDYRRLNKITKKDVYLLPRIDDTLDCLRGARFYSSMDLQSGYWQIDVEESDREKTAFITPDELYEFKVMPFGFCNAPATFERMIDNLLKGLKWTICLCYLDDIIVFSDGFEEHLRRLQLVLNCLKKAGLCLNSKKCKFGAKTITVLGHEVSENGIRPDQEKIRAVRDFATPRSLKEVRSFLGLSSYYRRFIPNYAHVAQPLNDLLKKDSAFNWNQEEQNAFEALKSALISEPALGHFDYSSPTEIHTDASNYGIGAVLVQIQKGKERAIAYASRTLNKAEKNYSTTERECLAIIWAINKFRPYVFGQPFTIVTDHHSLCWLTNLKDPCGRLARWALRLQEFDVTVVYKSGRKHQDADCLSRSPLEYSEDMEEDIPSIVTLQNFSEEQMNDQAIRKIADKLQSSPNNSFVKIDNTLYRKNYDPMGKPWLLVVPRHLRQELLKNFHDSPTAGHLGFTKTYDRIRKKYYWPGIYRTVRRYVAHCSDCQRRKHQPQLPSGHLQPIPVPEVAFEKVGMDLLGRFPTSEGGNRWIIVCTDYLTKYAITKALPTSESMEVAKFFIEDVILMHGAPRELITDRGRNFTSSMISDLNNQCRITHRKTTAYHPQTNGLTERLNKTIADMLSMYVDVNHKDWDRILPFVTFAYNTAKQESTGFTPFFLVHGREAETPLDVLFPKLLPEDDDFIQTLGARAEEARKLARIHSMRSQGSNKHRYDAHHRNIIYQPGDLVWIFIPVRKVGYSEKLMRRYFGPYKVTRKISDVTYEVETFGNQQGRRKTKDLVHIGRMKPYLNPGDQEDQLEEDPEDDSTNFQEEDIPTERTQQPQTREEISGPITRSRALRLRIRLLKKIVYCRSHTHTHTLERAATLSRAPPFSPLECVWKALTIANLEPKGSPGSAEQVPERPSILLPTGEELSPKEVNMKKTNEISSEIQKYANSPAGDMHANLAAARGDVTAPPTAAATSDIPASLNWADSEMVEVDDNEGFILVKSKKKRLSSTPEHAAKQGSRPAEKRGPQRQKRTTGPRSMPPQEIKATRANIADAKARQATTNHENYIFVELCPDIPDYSYLRAIGDLVGGPKGITHFGRMNGHYIVGLASRNLASRLVEEGLNIEGTLLKVFPFRKRAERIIVANLPGFVEDATIVQALRKYGDITSIAPIMIKMGEFAFSDGRREAFILLHEGVRLETLPARLTIQSKGDTLSAFLSFGIKCSKCGRQGHRRASCPSLARRNFDAPKRVDSPAQIQAAPPSPLVPKRTGPPTPLSSPPAPPAPSEKAPNNAPVTPAAAPGAPALHPARPPLPPGEAPSSTCSASNPPTTPALPSPAPAEPMEEARLQRLHLQTPSPGPAPAPPRDIIIGFTIASINARGLAIRNKSLSLCHLLRQHRVDIALVQETNTPHLDGAQDLCLGYDAITAPPDAISGSGLACIYAPGVTVSRHRILWPGHIVLAAFNVHGQEMTVINVHLSHDQRERIEQLRVIEAAAVEEEEEAWVLGDFNIRDDRNRDSISMAALGALCESAALLDAAPEFDAAHLPTRVAAHGDLIESSRLDRILAPARFLEVSTSYAIAPFHLSDHRMVLLRVGPPAAPSQPRVAATLRSGLAQEHMNNYLVDIAEEISMLDAPQLWDRWTLIKAGILAEARSLHDPRHHDRDDSYIGRAQRYIRVQLEASSTNADYPSLPDLARLTRHRRPAVTTIRDENGEVIEGPVLRRKALDIFRPRFARPSCDPAEYAAFIGATTTTPIELGEEDPLHRAEVSEAEVAAAIRRLPRGRAPGWDGLPCEVLSTFEEFFAVALRRVLAESQLRGALPSSMRRSEICLVPKARGRDRGLDGYRPISLPSADYRVIGSILLGRLRPHLPTLVPECQTYAVPGRSPSWNIARVTDAVEEATARGTPLAAVSVDLQSAFDSLDRGYLTSFLVSHLRLPPAFVGWILLLYAGADATIRVGGFQTVAFKLLNGVRQGCALSAALFSIATGPLLRRLETILGVGNVIAYADDIVLLFHRDEEFERVATVLEDFKRASGIAVNLGKSAGLWCGAWRNRGDSPLGASWSTTSIRILGLDIAPRSSVAHQEQHLLALLESACRRWTPFTRGLSLVGRARAANSLVGSTIQHHLHGYLPSPPTIAKLQARLARFVWGPEHTAWLPAAVMARPVAIGGLGLLDLATQLQLACLKGVQVALRGGRNGFDWLVASDGEAWIRPPPDGTRLQPRRLRLLKLWEEASKILSLNHRVVPTAQLLDLPIIGGCRFLRPPDLLAPARWRGARVRDPIVEDHLIARPTRSALADAAALGAFCRRLTSENAVGLGAESAPSSSSLAAAVVLRGTATPFLNGLTTRSARRALDRPRLAATPISRFTSRWSPTIGPPPSRIDWASLRRCAHSGHEADAALKLALHALPHPAHPASVGPSCPACGSIDRSLGHRYWCCRSIRPLIREAFNIIGRPPDLQAWIFGGSGLEDDAISILASAKLRIYRYFVQ
ncbi:K02A2.6-like, partial [Cordylochernes scorpioides]